MGRVPSGPLDEEERVPPTSLRAALRRLEKLHGEADALVRSLSCPASGDCCQLAVTGREPYLLPLEFELLSRHLAEAGRARPGPRPDGACPLLDGSGRRCSVYPVRPFGCRTFFCERVPGLGPSTNARLHQVSARITALSDEIFGAARPRTIREWFEKEA